MVQTRCPWSTLQLFGLSVQNSELVGFVSLLVVNEIEEGVEGVKGVEGVEGVMVLHLPIGSLKTRSGLEMVLRCEPSTC